MTREHFFIIAIMCNRRKLWKTITYITVVLAMSMTSVSHTVGAERRLYIYSVKELSSFMKDIGYQDLWHNNMIISRNSDGTAMRFINEDKMKILVVTCDGSVKVVDSPGPIAWLNDANQVIVWVTWTDNRGVTHYANGMSEKTPFSPEHGPDPSGKYFVKEMLDSYTTLLNKSCYTSIYATDKPNIPLAKVDICGVAKIFYKDNKVFLTGSQYLNGNWQEEEIRVFREKGNALEQIDRVIVPSPHKLMLFYAVDLNPWNDEVLYLDAYDFPSRSIWYTFNLKTHQLSKVGKVPWFGGRAFYLQCDIIKNVTEAKKRKTSH